MITKKYINKVTGQEIIVYPWSSKETKLKVEHGEWYQLFEESP